MSSVQTPFATIEEAIEDLRQGKMVVVVDDPTRENEGDLTMAAQFVTPEAINFMAKEGPAPSRWRSTRRPVRASSSSPVTSFRSSPGRAACSSG